jgi:hypothetical protein
MTSAAGLGRPRRWLAGLAWVLWALVMLGLAVVPWMDRLTIRAGRPDLAQLVPGSVVGPVVAVLSATTVGALVASCRPRHPVGWLLLGFALSLTASGVIASYVTYGLLARPGALPAAHAVARYYPATGAAALALLSLVLLLTPTGSLPSACWRWWAWVTAATPVALVLVVPVAPGRLDPQLLVTSSPFSDRALGGVLLVATRVALVVTALAVAVAAGSLLVRFRRAQGVERQQLRWVALAAALMVLAVPVVLLPMALEIPILVDWAPAVWVVVLPVAVGAAILRYRLYDLDRIVSRTLAYGLLTLLLAGGYALVVLGLGQLLGRESPWWWRPRPWPWRRCSSRPAAASKQSWIGGSTAAAMTPPRPLTSSRSVSGTRSTSTPSRPTCWRWSTRPCSRPRPRSGCGRDRPTGSPLPWVQERTTKSRRPE